MSCVSRMQACKKGCQYHCISYVPLCKYTKRLAGRGYLSTFSCKIRPLGTDPGQELSRRPPADHFLYKIRPLGTDPGQEVSRRPPAEHSRRENNSRRFLSLARGSNFLILSPRARRSIVKLEFRRGFNFLILRPRTRRSIVKLDSRTTRTQQYDGFPQ